MAVIIKLRRVANPRRRGGFAARMRKSNRRRSTRTRARANPKRRVRMTRNKNGRFVKRSVARRMNRRKQMSNPPRRKRYAVKATVKRRTPRKRNPMLVELGMVKVVPVAGIELETVGGVKSLPNENENE